MLGPGTTLGPYEIGAPLGAGGMGEVYRARDAKLGRDVELNILLDGVAQDADRVATFKREAQVLAASPSATRSRSQRWIPRADRVPTR